MAKVETDVLAEWVTRGYVTQEEADKNEEKYFSYIRQAKNAILDYCRIPLKAAVPDGLFYPWVDIGYSYSNGLMLSSESGKIKSVSDGDTTVTFGSDGTAGSQSAIFDYSAQLNRYRRLFP